MNIKSTWKRVTREDVLEEFHGLCQRAVKEGLFEGNYANYRCCGLYVSNRKTRNIGVCYSNHRTWEWCVVLNNKLLNCPIDKIRPILVHEIAHACCPTNHHGWRWQYTANKLGRQWGYQASRLCRDEEIIANCCEIKPRIYTVRCPKCGATWTRKVQCDIIKHPEFYTHTKCGCTLERVK